MKLKKTYRYAIISSLYLIVLSVISSTIIYLIFFNEITIYFVITTCITVFIISLVITQYRAEEFIYQRIKQLYNDIPILDIKDLKKDNITTDVETLTKSVKDYVKDKKEEIADLTERDSFRREFIGNVAHELKTPLFTIQGYILTLMEGAVNDKAIRQKYLYRANKGVERLNYIIKDLDMITKLETEGIKMNIENFDILKLIQNVFDLFEMKSKKRDITLKFNKNYEFPLYVNADKERIEQVLINLIINSIKYGKIGGTTIISIDDYNKNKFIIKVNDNGEGIEKKHINRLFERFYRIDKSRSRDQGGSGLGLAIAKHIIEAHNETISVKSTYGQGTEFSFTLNKTK